jgi:hypothetical protein
VFAADDVVFPSGDIALHGVVYRPEGKGPFPAVVYNHGRAAGMLGKTGFNALGPVFGLRTYTVVGTTAALFLLMAARYECEHRTRAVPENIKKWY